MRKRLIELIREAKKTAKGANCDLEREMLFADYLLNNGVIVPPCKAGDDIWWINENNGEIECVKGGIKAVVYNGETFEVLTEAGVEPIGTRLCMLSREEAEAALKGADDGQRKAD